MPEQLLRQYRLEPWLDLQPHLESLEIISFAFGPDAAVYVLAIVPPIDCREQRSGASFEKIGPHAPNSFVVLRCDDSAVNRVETHSPFWNFHHVQPLPNDELLLVCARSRYRGPDDYDANAHVFNLAGAFQRAFLLGDGIQDVQTTRDGRIWVSYFDEGIFGNYGWDDPVGASGLICWDQFGGKLYEYAPPSGLDSISDCYALNVATDRDTWCCYYTEFPIVHLRDHEVVASWESPIRGSSGFALYDNRMLMRGGYHEHDTFHMFELQRDGRVQEHVRYRFADEDNLPLTDTRVALRSSSMVILSRTRCYRVTVPDLL